MSRVQVGDPVAPRWLAADGTSLWVHEPTELVHVDMSNGAILGRVPTDSISYGYLAVGEGAVWQADFDRNTLLRIDPRTNHVVASIAVGSSPEGVAVTPGAIWVANHHDGTVSRIDPSTNRVVATITVGPNGSDGPLKMAADQSSVWVDVPNLHSVVRIDPATNRVALTVPVDGPLATDGNEVWIFGNQFGPEALRIDPASGAVLATVPVPSPDRGDIAIGLESVWLSSSQGLIRIDAKTASVVGELHCDGGDLAVGGAAVWISAEGQPYVLKITPL